MLADTELVWNCSAFSSSYIEDIPSVVNVQLCKICPGNNNSDEVKGAYVVMY